MIREALTRKMCGLLGPHQCQHILVGIGQAREKGQERIIDDKSGIFYQYSCKRGRQVHVSIFWRENCIPEILSINLSERLISWK